MEFPYLRVLDSNDHLSGYKWQMDFICIYSRKRYIIILLQNYSRKLIICFFHSKIINIESLATDLLDDF